MKIEDIKQILKTNYRHGLESKLTTRDTVRLFKYISQLEDDKLEMAKAIVEQGHYFETKDNSFNCAFCGEFEFTDSIIHVANCIVSKANKHIKEVEK